MSAKGNARPRARQQTGLASHQRLDQQSAIRERRHLPHIERKILLRYGIVDRRQKSDGLLGQCDGNALSGAAMTVGIISATLRNQGKGVTLPMRESLRPESFGVVPDTLIPIGAP